MKRTVPLAAVMILALATRAEAITYGTPTGTGYGNDGGLVGVSPPNGELLVFLAGDAHLADGLLTAARCGEAPWVGETVCVTFDRQLPVPLT